MITGRTVVLLGTCILVGCLDGDEQVLPPTPSLDLVSPASGSPLGGDLVELTGSEFATGSAVEVTFADTPGWVRIVSESTVEAITPPATIDLPDGAAEVLVDVTVTTQDGSAVLFEGFGYSCTAAEVYCSSACTDLDTSNDHCGACGSPCAATCTNGLCI